MSTARGQSRTSAIGERRSDLALARRLTAEGRYEDAVEVWTSIVTEQTDRGRLTADLELELAKAYDRACDVRAEGLYQRLAERHDVLTIPADVDPQSWDGGAVAAYADYLFRNSSPAIARGVLRRAMAPDGPAGGDNSDDRTMANAVLAKKMCAICLAEDDVYSALRFYEQARDADRDNSLADAIEHSREAAQALNLAARNESSRVRWTPSRRKAVLLRQVDVPAFDLAVARKVYGVWRNVGWFPSVNVGGETLDPRRAAIHSAELLADDGMLGSAVAMLDGVDAVDTLIAKSRLCRRMGDRDAAEIALAHALDIAESWRNPDEIEQVRKELDDSRRPQPLRDVDDRTRQPVDPVPAVASQPNGVKVGKRRVALRLRPERDASSPAGRSVDGARVYDAPSVLASPIRVDDGQFDLRPQVEAGRAMLPDDLAGRVELLPTARTLGDNETAPGDGHTLGLTN